MPGRNSIRFATANLHKLSEVRVILEKYGLAVESLKGKTVEVQSDSLDEIARRAAEEGCRLTGLALFVEDSGLFIDSLRGFPGPYSSYVHRTIGLEGLLKLMQGFAGRGASFRSAIAYCEPGSGAILFNGEVEGIISTEVRGTEGFGYDPIFIPEGETMTFAEMTLNEKNRLSHRSKAARRLAEWYLGRRDHRTHDWE